MALVALIAKILFSGLIGLAWINKNSMNPNYVDGQVVAFSRISDCDYGDVVLIDYRNAPYREVFIKRLIGKEGDTIEIINGVTYRNGTPLSEDYIVFDETEQVGPISVPEGEIFVMGDNRPVSLDSRNGEIGTIPKALVMGVVFGGTQKAIEKEAE